VIWLGLKGFAVTGGSIEMRQAGAWAGGVAAEAAADPLRQVAFRLGLVLVFLRFSMAQAIVTSVLHMNLYLLYIFGFPTLVGVALNGGIRRAFQGRPALFWTGYMFWLLLATVFSTWRSNSLATVSGYLRADFPILFVIGGLGVIWRDCRAMLHTLAWSGMLSVLTQPLFERSYEGGRLTVGVGSVSNPNDYAAHLILVLPFLLWEVFCARSKVVRVLSLGFIGLGLLLMLKTGSRGGLVAIVVASLFYLWRATGRQRLAMLLLGPVVAIMLVSSIPQSTLRRILSFSASDDAVAEALDSSESRKYLFWKSVEYTLEFPLFGVGPSQFADYEGTHNMIGGTTHGAWHAAHNTFTQISSECGIPALLFALGGVITSYRLMRKLHREAQRRPDCEDIRDGAFCGMLAIVGFCAAISFLNFAYVFYLPAMGGLAIMLSRGGWHEIERRSKATAAALAG
jgi:hypothetical protein